MEKKDYKFVGYKNKQNGPGRPPQPEMAKDLMGTWKKLFSYCRRYIVAFIVAIVCACVVQCLH